MSCKAPRERIGSLLKNGERRCILPCQELTNPSARSDCKEEVNRREQEKQKNILGAKISGKQTRLKRLKKQPLGMGRKENIKREIKELEQEIPKLKKEFKEKTKDRQTIKKVKELTAEQKEKQKILNYFTKKGKEKRLKELEDGVHGDANLKRNRDEIKKLKKEIEALK